jgi:hypothetical protein
VSGSTGDLAVLYAGIFFLVCVAFAARRLYREWKGEK